MTPIDFRRLFRRVYSVERVLFTGLRFDGGDDLSHRILAVAGTHPSDINEMVLAIYAD